MQFALVNNEKTEATPKSIGKCQLCDNEVFSKCGEINIWHWSHKKHESSDGWYEPETEWHRNWKLIFGKDNSEIVIKHEGIKHIADVLTSNDVVIELQNSPIRRNIIREREAFYGQRVLWLINGSYFNAKFSINLKDVFPAFVKHLKDGQIKILGKYLKIEQKRQGSFWWSWPRKSWSEVHINVFIDFGEEYLFWIKDGMGTNSGNGNMSLKNASLLSMVGTK